MKLLVCVLGQKYADEAGGGHRLLMAVHRIVYSSLTVMQSFHRAHKFTVLSLVVLSRMALL
jgi:hypothetical protein